MYMYKRNRAKSLFPSGKRGREREEDIKDYLKRKYAVTESKGRGESDVNRKREERMERGGKLNNT